MAFYKAYPKLDPTREAIRAKEVAKAQATAPTFDVVSG